MIATERHGDNMVKRKHGIAPRHVGMVYWFTVIQSRPTVCQHPTGVYVCAPYVVTDLICRCRNVTCIIPTKAAEGWGRGSVQGGIYTSQTINTVFMND